MTAKSSNRKFFKPRSSTASTNILSTDRYSRP